MIVDLARVRAAMRALDALVARFPRLRGPNAQERLANTLDEENEGGDRGSNGDNEAKE